MIIVCIVLIAIGGSMQAKESVVGEKAGKESTA